VTRRCSHSSRRIAPRASPARQSGPTRPASALTVSPGRNAARTGAQQEEVRHVTAHPAAGLCPQPERLGGDRCHGRIEIGDQQPGQFQPALIDHVRRGRRGPVIARVMCLAPHATRPAPGNRRHDLASPHIPQRPVHLAAISHPQRHHRLRKHARRLPAAAAVGTHEITSHTGRYRHNRRHAATRRTGFIQSPGRGPPRRGSMTERDRTKRLVTPHMTRPCFRQAGGRVQVPAATSRAEGN